MCPQILERDLLLKSPLLTPLPQFTPRSQPGFVCQPRKDSLSQLMTAWGGGAVASSTPRPALARQELPTCVCPNWESEPVFLKMQIPVLVLFGLQK